MPIPAPLGLRERVPLAPLTTLGLGGPARWFLRCASPADLRTALAWGRQERLPVIILGGGSNVIVPDAGLDALVLQVAIPGVTFAEARQETIVDAGAGVAWDELVAEAVRRGAAGVECLSGIPGTVGGTPIQNVGAYGQEVAETIVEVRALDREALEPCTFTRDECRFAYRGSRFKGEDAGRFVVTGVRFRLQPGGAPTLRYPELAAAVATRGGVTGVAPVVGLGRVRETVLALRRSKGMVLDPTDPDTRSAGSFFMNPVLTPEEFAALGRRWTEGGGSGAIPTFPAPGGLKVPAAWLIERAGFAKGFALDGARISHRHTLALVNAGGSTADLLALATSIREGVRARFGVTLEREPVLLA
ncbi:MAG TPA: UDP-N-acetylmuramate dehydrogenase [Gemmatimonadales bacterium]|nr:UDP-N-acetylmuramate dehydrogenase [Gemmatimonadales bacterium]